MMVIRLLISALVLAGVLSGYRLGRLRERKVRHEGFSLLEMMMVCLVVTVLLAMALPNVAQVKSYTQRTQALDQVRTVSHVMNAEALCVAQNLPCPSIEPLVPLPTILVYQGYTFTFVINNDGTWSYSAVPVVTPNRSYFADQTGLIRFADSGPASNGSPLVQ